MTSLMERINESGFCCVCGDSGMKVRLFSVRAGVSPVALSSSAVLKLLRSMRTQELLSSCLSEGSQTERTTY